ncbi:MAG TPA: hypothetical protein VGM09_25235, partial [Bradyrhizobium sp.]
MRDPKKFGRTLNKVPKKTNNAPNARNAKIEIRERVLAEIGAERAQVFDACCGEGEIYAGVWHRAAGYVGCDLIWYRDPRLVYVGDSRRLMRAIDLEPFNLFDFDPYGSPWEHVAVMAARRPVAAGERIGVVLTEGSALKVKLGSLPNALSILARMRPRVPGSGRSLASIIDRAISGMAGRMSCAVVKRWEAKGKTGTNMRYIGLILEGRPEEGDLSAASPAAQDDASLASAP